MCLEGLRFRPYLFLWFRCSVWETLRLELLVLSAFLHLFRARAVRSICYCIYSGVGRDHIGSKNTERLTTDVTVLMMLWIS